MSLFIASLNSGSNGNCYYIGNESEAVLIDAGIACREIEKRMKRLKLPIRKIKAIFVSHEHSDHIKGIEVLSKKYQLPVYITTTTLFNSGIKIENHLVISFKAYQFCNNWFAEHITRFQNFMMPVILIVLLLNAIKQKWAFLPISVYHANM
jgi:phosphoribosyl 1,2-cyclic phosphodiesterase